MTGLITADFVHRLGNPLFESTVLDRFKAASHLLLSNDVRSQKLADVKPFYSVTFVIASLNPDGNPFQLQLEFQDNGSKAERLNQRWLRLEPGERDFTPLMDINLADLEGGLSFHLGIAAAEAVAETRIPTHYRDFANNVKLDLRLARDYKGSDADSCFFSWPRKPNKQPTVPILGMTQKRAWIFMMKNSDYVAEVATVQNVVFDSDSVAAGPSIVDGRIEKATSGSGARPYEMRWAVQLWHQLWDMELPGNQDLGLGKKAKWRAEEWAFFPADKDEEAAKKSNGDEDVEDMFFYAGDGFRALMEKLKCLEGIVKGEELGNQGSEDEVSVTESTDTVGDDSDS